MGHGDEYGNTHDGNSHLEPPVERLGKAALGRHAFEEQMPASLARLIASEDSSNNVDGVIARLAHILAADPDTQTAYLSDAGTVQIHKLAREGHHFCGYRNIQMLCQSLGRIRPASAPEVVKEGKPSIPRIQHLVEQAWDAGINAHARVQTGGIRGTRKDIGTSEAEALLLHLGVACTGRAFSGANASAELFDAVEAYFASDPSTLAVSNGTGRIAEPSNPHPAIHHTILPPLFLQRPRHSVTVVGCERTRRGDRRLLVFDPAYAVPGAMRKTVSEGKVGWAAKLAIWRYRRGERVMRRWEAFELLSIDSEKTGEG